MPRWASLTDEKREEAFWKCLNKKGEDECWEWTKSLLDGYGRTSYKGKLIMAHRLAFQLHHKRTVSQGKILCHSCDNRKCCNPSHLREGTHKDNSKDAVERGRCARNKGIKNGRAKLTNEQVEIIKNRYKTERISQDKLAEEYGVAQHAISKVIRGVSYQT